MVTEEYRLQSVRFRPPKWKELARENEKERADCAVIITMKLFHTGSDRCLRDEREDALRAVVTSRTNRARIYSVICREW